MMKEYEKPLMNVILLNGDVITGSCPEDTYPCDDEMPEVCAWGEQV